MKKFNKKQLVSWINKAVEESSSAYIPFPIADPLRPVSYTGKPYEGHEVYTMTHFQKGMPYMEERLKHDITRHLAERLIEEDVVEWEVHEDTSHKSSLVLKAKVNLYKAK